MVEWTYRTKGKTMRKIIASVAMVLALALPLALHSSTALCKPMTFRATSEISLVASGSIISDQSYWLFVEAANQMPRLRTVYFNSPGGNVAEAIKIGREIHKRNLDTFVNLNAECSSSCVWTFLAGRNRTPLGSMAIHQLTFDDPLSSSDTAVSAVQEVLSELGNYLDEINIPHRIIDYSMLVPRGGSYVMSIPMKQYLCVASFADRTIDLFNPQCHYRMVFD